MNSKRRFRMIALFLATVAAVSCAYYSVLSVANEYYWAQSKLNMYREGVQGWEACRKMKPEFYRANTEAVSYCLKSFNEAQDNFWVKLPRSQLVALYVLAGAAGAAGGYLATFAAIWFGGLAAYEFIRRSVLGLRDQIRHQAKSPQCQHPS
jgi:hypothetical protein